jgi:hypothetical protein
LLLLARLAPCRGRTSCSWLSRAARWVTRADRAQAAGDAAAKASGRVPGSAAASSSRCSAWGQEEAEGWGGLRLGMCAGGRRGIGFVHALGLRGAGPPAPHAHMVPSLQRAPGNVKTKPRCPGRRRAPHLQQLMQPPVLQQQPAGQHGGARHPLVGATASLSIGVPGGGSSALRFRHTGEG